MRALRKAWGSAPGPPGSSPGFVGGESSSGGGGEAWEDEEAAETGGTSVVVFVQSAAALVSSASFVALSLSDPFGRLKGRRAVTVAQLHSVDPVWNRRAAGPDVIPVPALRSPPHSASETSRWLQSRTTCC